MIQLQIVTPSRRVLAEEVDELILPGSEGYLGVRPGHAPLLTELQIGEISYRVGGTDRFLAISGGFVEVLREGVSVLATTAEFPEEIDIDRAKQARERAEQRLKGTDPNIDVRRAEIALARAANRMTVHGRGRV